MLLQLAECEPETSACIKTSTVSRREEAYKLRQYHLGFSGDNLEHERGGLIKPGFGTSLELMENMHWSISDTLEPSIG